MGAVKSFTRAAVTCRDSRYHGRVTEQHPDDLRTVDLSEDGPEILPDQTSDDTDLGWGEWRDSGGNDDRLLEDRPPHW